MNNQTLLNNGWKSKTVRIKPDYNKLCIFLIYQLNEDISMDKSLFDNILNSSLKFIEENGINCEMNNFHGREYPKGFLITEETMKRIDKEYIKTKRYFDKDGINLSVGEFYELMLYIYCKNKLEDRILNIINIDWGFTFL